MVENEDEKRINDVIYYKKTSLLGYITLTDSYLNFFLNNSDNPKLKIPLKKVSAASSYKLHNIFYSLHLTVPGSVYIFSNLEKESISQISSFFDFSPEEKEIAAKGLNIGKHIVTNNSFSFYTNSNLQEIEYGEIDSQPIDEIEIKESDEENENPEKKNLETLSQKRNLIEEERYKSLIEIPFNLISKSTNQSKTELDLELLSPESPNDDILCSLKFSLGEFAPFVNDKIQANSSQLKLNENFSLKFENVLFLLPRGRINVLFYPNFLYLEGKSNNFKIYYKGIQKMILVKKSEEKRNVVIEINPPISVGQTYYSFLVLEFDIDDYFEEDFQINFIDNNNNNNKEENEKEEKENEGLKRIKQNEKDRDKEILQNQGIEKYEKFCSELKEKTSKKIIIPKTFLGKNEINGIKTDFKTANGILHFLENSILFLPKPILFFEHKEIIKIELLRWNDFVSKSFDLKIVVGGKHFDFSNIEKDELKEVVDYLVTKGIRIQDLEEVQKVSVNAKKGREGGRKRMGMREMGFEVGEEGEGKEEKLIEGEEGEESESDVVVTEGESGKSVEEGSEVDEGEGVEEERDEYED